MPVNNSEEFKMSVLELTDNLWFKIAPLFLWISESLGAIFYPFMLLGPIAGIACIAGVTLSITKILSILYKPHAIEELQKEFKSLEEMRKEAAQIGAKQVCKGCDDEMDKIYFEQMRLSIVRGSAVHSIPILAMLCWVWSYFSPDRLQAVYGKPYIIKLPFKIGIYDYIGPAFWFVISIICAWGIYAAIRKKRQIGEKRFPGNLNPEN